MAVSASRRALLRGYRQPLAIEFQPPWTGDDFTDVCTRCGDCVAACPEQVLAPGDGGFPQVVFRGEGCTFCGECVDSCGEPVFDLGREPFQWRAEISNRCLALNDIHCQSCQDACEPGAIRFRPRLGKPPEPVVSSDICTGCFACAAVCPQDAISLPLPAQSPEVTHG